MSCGTCLKSLSKTDSAVVDFSMLTLRSSTGQLQLLRVGPGRSHLVNKRQTGPPGPVQSEALESQTRVNRW